MALAETFDKASAGKRPSSPGRTLIAASSANSSGGAQTRRVLLVQPVMDYSALQPGAAASNAIRAAARSLGLDPAHGVSMRLTGPVPLADEEFASLAEDWHLVAAAMVVALLGILWVAVRSARVVLAILVTTLIGLIMTAGVGLLATGRFNLISVAFIPLFVGLGIDFSIQFSVRFLAERRFHPELRAALTAAGLGVGRALALAAAAIGVGFFAFLPTSYIGVAELGVIAGLGMAVAFGLSITFLPALLGLLRPAPGGMRGRLPGLAPVEAFLGRIAGGSFWRLGFLLRSCPAALLPFVRFDFNPLHLKSPKVELMVDPPGTRRPIPIGHPIQSTFSRRRLLRRIRSCAAWPRSRKFREWSRFRASCRRNRTRSSRSFMQRRHAWVRFFGRFRWRRHRTRSCSKTLAATAAALRQAATGGSTDSAAVSARRLAEVLDRLQQAAPDVRATAAEAVVLPLGVMLERVRALLQAGPVT